jgi:hypothetical protein
VDSKKLKYGLAFVGTGAVLAMGGLSIAIGNVNAAGPQVIPAAEQSTDIHSETRNPGAPETSVAVPPITTAPYVIPTGEPQ